MRASKALVQNLRYFTWKHHTDVIVFKSQKAFAPLPLLTPMLPPWAPGWGQTGGCHLEHENDDVICCFRAKYHKISPKRGKMRKFLFAICLFSPVHAVSPSGQIPAGAHGCPWLPAECWLPWYPCWRPCSAEKLVLIRCQCHTSMLFRIKYSLIAMWILCKTFDVNFINWPSKTSPVSSTNAMCLSSGALLVLAKTNSLIWLRPVAWA